MEREYRFKRSSGTYYKKGYGSTFRRRVKKMFGSDT